MVRKILTDLKTWLGKRYRVEFIDDQTLSQFKSFVLVPIRALLLGLLLLLMVIGGTASIFIYTPSLHQLIPGYINPAEFSREQAEMISILDEKEREIAKWGYLLNGLKHVAGIPEDSILSGSQTPINYDSLRKAHLATRPQAVQVVDRSPARPEPVDHNEQAPSPPAFVMGDRHSASSTLLNLFPPIEGTVRKPFDESISHFGVDFVADENALVRSVFDGFVIFSEYSEETGHVLGVMGSGSVLAFYKHNSRLFKRVGSYVTAGEPVAVIGNSGENSTGPHLHLELWVNGVPVDPMIFLTTN